MLGNDDVWVAGWIGHFSLQISLRCLLTCFEKFISVRNNPFKQTVVNSAFKNGKAHQRN